MNNQLAFLRIFSWGVLMKMALNLAGQLVSAGDAVLLGSGQYFCPRCQKPVQLKGGQQTVPYFAHQTKVVGGGGESDAHQTGKVAIAALANALGWQADFELVVNPEQRADVYLTKPNCESQVIEYQCSPLTPTQLLKRTQGYHASGLAVTWIVGDRFRFKSRHLSRQQLAFLNYCPAWGFYLVCYSTQLHCWVLQHHVVALEFQGYQWRTQYFKPRQLVAFLSKNRLLKPINIQNMPIDWQRARLMQRLKLRDERFVRLQQICYQQGTLLQKAPDWCFYQSVVPPLYQQNQFESRLKWWLAEQPVTTFSQFCPTLNQPLIGQQAFRDWSTCRLQQALRAKK